MAGSDYYMPVADNDVALSSDRQAAELQKLRAEYRRRLREDPQARQKRTENYRKLREQNGELMRDFPDAFTFELAGEAPMNGHAAWLLAATPRKKTGSIGRTAKVLAGMRGRMWVDKDTFQVIRAESQVVVSVSIFGIFARVLPGSRMELETAPVDEALWLASRFSMTLEISKFWFHSTQATSSTYSQYRLNEQVLRELLPEAPAPQP